MTCTECGSDRVASASAKCSDLFSVSIHRDRSPAVPQIDYSGYVPHDMNIGGGDYFEIDFCLRCGKIQADFPVFPQIERDADKPLDKTN